MFQHGGCWRQVLLCLHGSHYLLGFGRTVLHPHPFADLHGSPGEEGDDGNVFDEIKVDDRHVDNLSEENDGGEVDQDCQELAQKDDFAPVVESGEDVKDFREDQGCECDGHDAGEGGLEKPEGEQYDDRPLINAHPHPYQESF